MVIFAFALFLLRQGEKQKFSLLVKEQQSTKEILIKNIIDLMGKNLESWAFNDTYWDEMVNCVEKADTVWGNQVIASAIPTYNAHAAWIYNTAFDLIYNNNILGKSFEKHISLSKENLSDLISKNNFSHFFIYTSAGLMEIRGAPIQPSFDIQRRTNPRGFFFVGRLWSKEYLDQLSVVTSSNVALSNLNSVDNDKNEYSIMVKEILKDWKGNPLAYITFRSESVLLKEPFSALNRQTTIGLVFGITIIAVISVFLFYLVSNPLSNIAKSLEAEDSKFIKKLLKNKTEFGKIAHLIVFFFKQKHELSNEIIERKKIEDEIRRYIDELKELNASKDKFFSIIAHDLKSPFMALLGITQLLSEDFENLSKEELKRFIEVLRTDTREIFNLILNLLDWSRLQSGRMEYNPSAFYLKDLVEQVTNLLKSSALKKHISFNVFIKDCTTVIADRNMTLSVLQNLVTNAIKFTRKNGKIEIIGECNEPFVKVTIKDNGVGISPSNLEKLFQIDSEVTTKGTEGEKGTGLGLLICKDMIERNEGKIWVESEVDKGTSFYFTLKKAKNKKETREI